MFGVSYMPHMSYLFVLQILYVSYVLDIWILLQTLGLDFPWPGVDESGTKVTAGNSGQVPFVNPTACSSEMRDCNSARLERFQN